MFNKINLSHLYVGFISGIAGAAFTLLLSAILPPFMQKSETFSEITCTKLTVVDAERNRMVTVSSNEYGGIVRVSGISDDVKSSASMYLDTLGGVVRLIDKDGEIHAFEGGKIQSFR